MPSSKVLQTSFKTLHHDVLEDGRWKINTLQPLSQAATILEDQTYFLVRLVLGFKTSAGRRDSAESFVCGGAKTKYSKQCPSCFNNWLRVWAITNRLPLSHLKTHQYQYLINNEPAAKQTKKQTIRNPFQKTSKIQQQ